MVGGAVLAGGRSRRMGRPKATLEWHGSTFVRRVVEAVSDADAAAPAGPQPLAAAYRIELANAAERLLAEGERRARALLEHARVNWLYEPGPESVDDPEAYEAARARPAPLATFGGRHVRAATLGALLPEADDPELPLVDGDVVQVTRSEPV
jgi:molybdopterin-guanine dinucleotide biosynthesis protein A